MANYGPTLAECLKRRRAAVKVAYRFAQTDGGHHKMWVIDQMLRRLLGPQEYKAFVKGYVRSGEYEWDTGIAP